MKPTKTCNLARSILRSLGSHIRTEPTGAPSGDLVLPSVDMAPEEFRVQYQAYNLCRKIELPDTRLAEQAIATWLENEQRCKETNRDLIDRVRNSCPFDKKVIIRASQLIAECIGEKPNMSSIFEHADFSGGASTSRRRDDADAALKWWARPSLHVTPLALPILLDFKDSLGELGCVWDNPGDLSSPSGVHDVRPFYTVVKGSRLSTTAKNYRTERVILIEPDGNMLLQKGIGSELKELLLTVGIDLRDQTYNQRLALRGSIDNSIATVDGEAASDLIARLCPAILFPEAWYDLLYRTRSHIVELPDGTWHTLHKLSSMGNGYTFEVESLIFWALTQALVDVASPKVKVVSVFGDDVICPSSVYTSLVRIYAIFGFRINTEKSYWNGPFRESCGKHYHMGLDVSPFHIRSEVDSLCELFRLLNQSHSWEGYVGPVTSSILRMIPMGDRRQIPLEYPENQGIYSEEMSTKLVSVRKHRSYGTVLHFSVFVPTSVKLTDRWEDECRWFYSIMHGHTLSSSGPVLDEYLLLGDKGWSDRKISTSGDNGRFLKRIVR